MINHESGQPLKKVRDLLRQSSVWLRDPADEAGIVLSTRVRLARNLRARYFPARHSEEDGRAILEEMLQHAQSLPDFAEGLVLGLEGVSRHELELLGERQLLPPAITEHPFTCGIAAVPDESLSLLINEEDHLRLQSLHVGFDVDSAYEAADDLESKLDARVDFAYSDRFGFLTACPTNAGTGMRASVLIHLAGLVLSKKIDEELKSLHSKHWTVRGFRGEGSSATGAFFQISNSATLGLREGEILKNLEQTVVDLMERERSARESLLSRARTLLEDRIWRSFGILSNARTLSAQETLHHGSLLRLGHAMKVLRVPTHVLSDILALSQDAHTHFLSGATDGEVDRNAWRAERIRNKLRGAKLG